MCLTITVTLLSAATRMKALGAKVAAPGRLLGAGRLGEVEGDDEAAGAGQQRAAREREIVRGHDQPSRVRAAAWIAVRMRA